MTGLSKSISCFDRIFDKALCDKYNLSIRMQPDGLFYSVYDPVEGKYIGFEAVVLAGVSEIYNYISGHPFLNKLFNKKISLFPAYKFTLIPTPLFIEGKENEYIDFAHLITPNEVVGAINLNSANAKMIYAADHSWIQIIEDHFNESIRYPMTAAFIDLVLLKYRTSRTSGMFINIYEQNFDLLLIENGKLKYCNNFNYKSDEDLIYYTIFVVDQLNVNAEKIDVKLMGSINEKSGMLKLLRKYIRNVELLNLGEDTRLSYAMADIAIHNYPDLFNSRLCEL